MKAKEIQLVGVLVLELLESVDRRVCSQVHLVQFDADSVNSHGVGRAEPPFEEKSAAAGGPRLVRGVDDCGELGMNREKLYSQGSSVACFPALEVVGMRWRIVVGKWLAERTEVDLLE